MSQDNGSDLHCVNYCVMRKLFDDDFQFECDTLQTFLEWAQQNHELDALVLAHNFRGYDGRLLLAGFAQLHDELKLSSFIQAGTKYNSFKYGNLEFRCSLLHIAAPLDQFPKIFGLDIVSKGFFPYLFNRPENQNYSGAIPPVEVFDPNKMSSKRRQEFFEWYDEVKDEPYHFREQMIKYCQMDVEIMKRGLEVYIQTSKQVNEDMNPLESITIASAAYKIWRTLHMPENVISYYGKQFHEVARAALRGGRTDVRCMYRKWTPEQVFRENKYGVYADVQSMYPYIQMTKDLPVGLPHRIYSDLPADAFGIVKCSLNPPEKFVFHPALCIPDKESGRLCAPLLSSRLKEIHITSVELEQALDQGYQLEKLYFIDQYDRSDQLFKDYIRKFLKIKVEKSKDYPGDAKFAELKQMYSERCGVELDPENFEANPGMKQLAKLYLNSLWGKLCERPNYENTYHLNREDFFRMEEEEECALFMPKTKIQFNDNSFMVRGEYVRDDSRYSSVEQRNMAKVSPAIGAFITMYGRSMLLEQMLKLDKRALYHDTDSIVYEYDPSKYNIPLGKCLGDWEDELDGKPMVEFVSLAPKTYSYRYLDKPQSLEYNDGPYWEWDDKRYPVREVTKVKGIRQNYDTQKYFDFNSLKDLVDGKIPNIQVDQLMFNWNSHQHEMSTYWTKKVTQLAYMKGVIGRDYFTYPPGVENYWDPVERVCETGDPQVNPAVQDD